MSQNKNKVFAAVGGLVGTAVALPAAAWIVYSKLFIDHNLPLPDAIPAAKIRFNSEAAGSISCYYDKSGSGRPLLLIHSVNAAASAYEMRPLFEHYRGTRPVYAIDLPGYGFSDRSARKYTVETFEKVIVDLVKNEIGEPVDAVALSLGSEFLARAALAEPDWFRSITLISPSGFNARGEGRATQRVSANESSDTAYKILAFPLWGQALFDLIATRRSIKFFLEKSFVGDIANGFVDYGYLASHQPGAANVPLYFVSGRLFTPGVKTAVYEKVTVPSLIIYDEDFYSRFDTLPDLVEQKDNWQAARIVPTRGLPHWEQLPKVVETLNNFWQNQS
ncbi:MAG: alpha/beta hydrolase [Ardenticatenaceae bacterium]|nr:alpha/beta hydrolase [Ardenticatenaceae bacterium]MCB9445344.1 alpha/beta hydrolase [Ardenticatenaceae bacterium]